ncbi:MAG: peptide chain release factor N(5)-glutamine methyltransferase [Bacillota bacterium]|nr:peptide chain release factor N(5)-glutamine methyltransferase [Bacillota bacterium]
MTYREFYNQLKTELSFRENTANECRWLLELAAGGKYINIEDKAVTEASINFVQSAVSRLRDGVPFQYAVGVSDFYGLSFKVNENVLIPRPETEILVETAIIWAKSKNRPIRALDICTGSGCIAITLAKYLAGVFVAGDISALALDVAQANAELNGVEVDLRRGDLLAVAKEGESFDLITANPPYLTADDMKNILPEVAKEPFLALYGGEDGLDLCRRILATVPHYLAPDGLFLMEIGEGQGDAVLSLAAPIFREAVIVPDLSRKPRFLRGLL